MIRINMEQDILRTYATKYFPHLNILIIFIWKFSAFENFLKIALALNIKLT